MSMRELYWRHGRKQDGDYLAGCRSNGNSLRMRFREQPEDELIEFSEVCREVSSVLVRGHRRTHFEISAEE